MAADVVSMAGARLKRPCFFARFITLVYGYWDWENVDDVKAKNKTGKKMRSTLDA